jgi:hypothetical protein
VRALTSTGNQTMQKERHWMPPGVSGLDKKM